MTDWAWPKRDQASWDGAGRAEDSGRRRRRTALLVLLAGTLVPVLAAGCTRSLVVPVNESNFKRVVLDSKQPVLVNFYKYG